MVVCDGVLDAADSEDIGTNEKADGGLLTLDAVANPLYDAVDPEDALFDAAGRLPFAVCDGVLDAADSEDIGASKNEKGESFRPDSVFFA